MNPLFVLNLVASLVSSALAAEGTIARQIPPSGIADAAMVERGPHHKLLKRMSQHDLPSGPVQTDQSFVQEMVVGLNFFQQNAAGQWESAESQELIEPCLNGYLARYGLHKVAFAPNLNISGAIQVPMTGFSPAPLSSPLWKGASNSKFGSAKCFTYRRLKLNAL